MNPTYIHKNMVRTHHFILLSATTLCKMTVYDLQLLHVRYRIEIKKKRNELLFTYTLPVSFTGSYIDDEPNFPQQNNLVLQKIVAGVRQDSEFQGLFMA